MWIDDGIAASGTRRQVDEIAVDAVAKCVVRNLA